MISVLFLACLAVAGAVAKPDSIIVKPLAPLSDEIIDYVNTVQNEWRAAPFKRFSGMSLSALKGLMGTRLGGASRLPTKVFLGHKVEDLPENFDGRTQWPNCPSLTDVRDQANCGSCWAFASVEAMSDRLCIAKNIKVNISAENLLACCDDCGDGCQGGYPFQAYRWFQNEGLVTGGQYNTSSGCQTYSLPHCDHHVTGRYPKCTGDLAPTPKCSHSCRPSFGKTYKDDLIHGGTPYTLGNVHSIMMSLHRYGSVTAAFTVYADFPTYKSGVYHHTHGEALGGHAIKIIGYGVENGVDYWLVANSWNSDWGDNGFFKIRRGVNECGIEDDVVAAEFD